jgi:hypothetical protein
MKIKSNQLSSYSKVRKGIKLTSYLLSRNMELMLLFTFFRGILADAGNDIIEVAMEFTCMLFHLQPDEY